MTRDRHHTHGKQVLSLISRGNEQTIDCLGKTECMTRILLLLLTLGFQYGCVSRSSEHSSWHSSQSTALGLSGQDLTEVQLQSLVGSPDYLLSPSDFYARLGGDVGSRNTRMFGIWEAYGRAREEGRQGMQWNESTTFLDTALWLYDESIHFRQPPHSGLINDLCCGRAGFACYVYIVSNGKVLGSAELSHWKGLPTK